METQVKLLNKIGSGAFGVVYKCVYKGKEHVVKKIPISSGEFTFKSVIAEFDILTKVRHPRIVKFVKFFQTMDDWNFILEYCENGSLRGLMIRYHTNRWKFGESDLLALFMDIVNGVKYLHSRNIIHRDIKPENVLVDIDFRMKIADFGVSKVVQNTADHHTAIGTLSYMAPEVYQFEKYDHTVDIWALGVVFYEMAMLEHPFRHCDQARVYKGTLSFIPPKIDYARRNYKPAVQDLLVMMLQRDPKLRASLNKICEVPIVAEIAKRLRTEEEMAESTRTRDRRDSM